MEQGDAAGISTDARLVQDGPILICYDGSRESERAIVVAARLFGQRSAIVLDVAPLMIGAGWAPAGSDVAVLDQLALDDALARATAGVRIAEAAGFEATARADAALDTWRAVNEVATEIGAAAIVIGSRGLTGLHALLKGSLSRAVEAHAHRPVLVVPPAA